MTTQNIGPIVDADSHVLEPADTWQKYIDPQYRDRAVRLEHDDNGWEVLMFDNKPLNILRGILGAMGGVGSDTAEAEAFFYAGQENICGWLSARQLRRRAASQRHGRGRHRYFPPLPDDRHRLGRLGHRPQAGHGLHPGV
jgi:hypothetical protein